MTERKVLERWQAKFVQTSYAALSPTWSRRTTFFDASFCAHLLPDDFTAAGVSGQLRKTCTTESSGGHCRFAFGVAGGRAPNDLARHCDFFFAQRYFLRGVTLTGIKG